MEAVLFLAGSGKPEPGELIASLCLDRERVSVGIFVYDFRIFDFQSDSYWLTFGSLFLIGFYLGGETFQAASLENHIFLSCGSNLRSVGWEVPFLYLLATLL
jgi:hypothetical protein